VASEGKNHERVARPDSLRVIARDEGMARPWRAAPCFRECVHTAHFIETAKPYLKSTFAPLPPCDIKARIPGSGRGA